jgi:hypothetical protein
MDEPRWRRLSGCVLAVLLLAGCTPGAALPQTTPTATLPSTATTSASATPTPTPTATRNATQATAIKVVEDYLAARDRLFDDPSKFTKDEAKEALAPFAGQQMLDGYLDLFAQLKKAGERYEGPARLSWIVSSGVFGSGAGESVNVTACRDSTGRTLVDRDGKTLAEIKPAIREFEVRNTAAGFRIVGEKEGFGAPCP